MANPTKEQHVFTHCSLLDSNTEFRIANQSSHASPVSCKNNPARVWECLSLTAHNAAGRNKLRLPDGVYRCQLQHPRAPRNRANSRRIGPPDRTSPPRDSEN